MAKQIAKLLKTDVMADIDMPAIAQFLQSQGRRGDSILAHINPKEAALLQSMGGAATPNPVTGLPEFYSYGYSSSPYASEFDLYGDQMSGGDFDEARVQATERRPNSRVMENRSIEINEPQIVAFDPSAQNYDVPSQGIAPDFPVYAPSGYGQTITAPNYGVSNNRNFDVIPAFKEKTYYSPPSQTISTDYLGNVNLGGTGEFTQIPDFSGSVIDTEFPKITKEQQPVEDSRNIYRRGVDYLKETTGLSGNELARLGLAAGLGIQGALASREAAKQGREARAEQERIARPYRERGAELLAQAESGQLTPQGQQSLAALRARVAQGAESRGGVGAQQAQAQIENYRQQLLANQYDYGMKISNIGDQLMLGAIRTGLEADRYATNMTNNYYTNMARILVGMGANEQDLKEITKSGNGGQ